MARAIDADALLEKLQRMIDYCKDDNQVNGLTALFQVGDAIMDCPTLTPPNEWVAVEERLPEYNPGTGAKSYWVAKKDNAGNWQMKIAQYCDYGYAMTMDAETEVTWRDWDFTKIANVTHWMPMPAPPGKGNNVPTNEPLTIKELREMDGEPVYDYLGQEWYVIQEYYDHELTMTDGTRFFDDDEIDGVDKRFYRRPPEGEEDT